MYDETLPTTHATSTYLSTREPTRGKMTLETENVKIYLEAPTSVNVSIRLILSKPKVKNVIEYIVHGAEAEVMDDDIKKMLKSKRGL